MHPFRPLLDRDLHVLDDGRRRLKVLNRFRYRIPYRKRYRAREVRDRLHG
jgi:hypothetical protein